MLWSAVMIAFLLAPLGCWALLARTKVLGWTFAVVFAAYAGTEWFLSSGWPLGFERRWLSFPAEPGNRQRLA
jgi:hypothetical protein